MSDLLIDPLDHRDLVFSNGALTVIRDVEARRQRADIALRHFYGEWFLDRNQGTDFFGKILGKSSDLSRRAEIRRRLLDIPGIVEVQSMTLTVDPRTRALGGLVQVLDVTGQVVDLDLTGVV
jgi:hypothetical protein